MAGAGSQRTKVVVVGLACGLAVSLAFNWVLLRQKAVAPPAPLPQPIVSAQGEREPRRVLDVFAALPKRAPAAAMPAPAVPSASSPSAAPLATVDHRLLDPEVGVAVQQDLLSQIAREKLHAEWLGQRDSVLAHLRSQLADPDKLAQDLRRDAEEYSKLAGATPEAAARFFEDYAAARARREEACRVAVAADPPRWQVLFDELRGMFADEDRLTEQRFGPEARQRLRAAQLEKRTVVLAIAAVYAGKPWDATVGW